MRELIRKVVTISPRSVGIFIVIAGWEVIYQALSLLKVVGSELSGFFIVVGTCSAVAFFTYDVVQLKKNRKRDRS